MKIKEIKRKNKLLSKIFSVKKEYKNNKKTLHLQNKKLAKMQSWCKLFRQSL